MSNKFFPPRTTTTTRTTATPRLGELLFDIDEKKLYVGDGITQGGKPIVGTESTGGGGLTIVYINSSTLNATSGNCYLVDGTTTVNLPVGEDGNQIGIADYAGDFLANPLTIIPNGTETIAKLPDLTLDRNHSCLTLGFYSGNWVITSLEAFDDQVGGMPDWSNITNKPTFSTVATSGSYDDLVDKPTFSTTYSDLADVDTTGLQVGQTMFWNGTVWIPGNVVREVLTTNRTYYVRTDGNDNNNGLSNTTGGAFATIQKGVNFIASLDLSIYQVTLQIQEGATFTGNIVLSPTTGVLPPIIQGGVSRPILTCSTGTVLTVKGFANWKVKQVEFANTVGATDLIKIEPNATLTLPNSSNVMFGATQRFSILNLGFLNLDESEGGNNLFISGGSASAFGAFLRSFGGTAFTSAARGIWTLTNTPSFLAGFIYLNQGAVADFVVSTFTGSGTGKRYDVSSNAVVRVTDASTTFFPGNSSGTTASGGQYV